MLWTLAAGLLAVGAPADSASTVELGWAAPSECGSADAFETRVAGFLGRSLDEVQGEPVRAAVEIARVESGLEAQVRLETAAGSQTRALSDPDCAVLGDAAAFIVAVAIDPDAALRLMSEQTEAEEPEVDGEPPEQPMPESEPEPTREPEPEPAPARTRARRGTKLGGAARLGARGSGGLLPGFAPALDLAGALLIGRARVEAQGSWHFERGISVARDGTALLSLWDLGLSGCFEPSVQRVEFPLCGGLSAGQMRARTRGLRENGSAAIPWVSIDAGGGVAYVPARWVALRLDVEARVPLNRPEFTVENLGVVHAAWPVAVSGTLGVEARFP